MKKSAACALGMAFLNFVPGINVGCQPALQAKLDRPLASSMEELSEITALYELAPGRVLVADENDLRLVLIDFASSKATTIGRVGSGPREFRSMGRIVARPGGGAYVVDYLQHRLLPVTPAGVVLDAVSVPLSAFEIRAIDSTGRIFGERAVRGSNTPVADSAYVARADLTTARIDTLVVFHSGRSLMTHRRGEPRHVWSSTAVWNVLLTGEVLILDAASYRLTSWKDGVQLSSTVLPFERMPVTEADRAAWRDEHKNERPRFLGAGGTPTGSANPTPAPLRDGGQVFPATLPAFAPGRPLWVARDGNLWMERLQGARSDAPRYDVIAPAGRIISQVALPARSEVVGFGAGTVYVAEKDADNVVRLRQYRYPQLPSASRARPD